MNASIPANQRLTNQGYWDGVYAGEEWSLARSAPASKPARALALLEARLKKLLGSRLIASMSAYDEYMLWDVILPRYLEGRSGEKVVEIGSAPGQFLVRLKHRFGLVPYGIDFSSVGADLNRQLFAAGGADPANVIQADFFDPALHERYRGWFDVVVSRGFIEHFRDVEDVIRKHLNLLRSGGLLVVAIPNLQGINKQLSALFHREVLAMHNQNIMTRERFASLFPSEQAERLFCGYYGTFSFYLFRARPGSPMRVLLAACMKAQPVLNSLFRLLLKERGAESSWFSPTLLFVGVKR